LLGLFGPRHDILKLSRLSRTEMAYYRFDLSAMVRDIAAELQAAEPERQVNLAAKSKMVKGVIL
jgi:hypothetical protein